MNKKNQCSLRSDHVIQSKYICKAVFKTGRFAKQASQIERNRCAFAGAEKTNFSHCNQPH